MCMCTVQYIPYMHKHENLGTNKSTVGTSTNYNFSQIKIILTTKRN